MNSKNIFLNYQIILVISTFAHWYTQSNTLALILGAAQTFVTISVLHTWFMARAIASIQSGGADGKQVSDFFEDTRLRFEDWRSTVYTVVLTLVILYALYSNLIYLAVMLTIAMWCRHSIMMTAIQKST